jgi:hypothetical protein
MSKKDRSQRTTLMERTAAEWNDLSAVFRKKLLETTTASVDGE